MKVPDLAAGRADDKGDALALTVVARDADACAVPERALTEEDVQAALNRSGMGPVTRYAATGLWALKSVVPNALSAVHALLHAGLHCHTRVSMTLTVAL